MLVFGTVWSTTNRGGNFVLNDVDRNSVSLLLVHVDILRGTVAQNKWPIKFCFYYGIISTGLIGPPTSNLNIFPFCILPPSESTYNFIFALQMLF